MWKLWESVRTMLESAGHRFLRGLREPWELAGRMRQNRPLWNRYWRTVLVQAGLTLVVGAGVFWVGKQGAEAWNDAFGPEEPAEAVAPGASGAPATGAPAASKTSAAAPAATAAQHQSAPVAPSAPSAPPAPSPPPGTATGADTVAGKRASGPAPDPATPPEARSADPGAPPTSPSKAVGPPPAAGTSPAGADTEEAEDAEETESGDAPDDAALEAQIEALKNAPPGERAKRTAELVAAAVARAQTKASQAERAGKKQGKSRDAAQDLAEARSDLKDTIDELALEAETLASMPSSTAGETKRERRRVERRLEKVEREAVTLERRGAAALSAAERGRLEHARASLASARRHERGFAGRLGAVLALLAAIYASLGIAQTAILALSRDFHDALSRDLSLLVHVAPEDPPMRPKIRLDLPWVRRKANRRAQFFLGFLPGQALISLVAKLVPPHRVLATVLTAVWASYWWMVMTAGQSARAWSPPETTPRPWYLRAWFALTDRVILFRWALPRMWGRLWERFARRFNGPSERVEEQPFEFAGLALSRALTLFPVVKLLLRPLFPVCAAHLLVEHASIARLPVAVTPAEVAEAASHAPDPEARAHSGVPAR